MFFSFLSRSIGTGYIFVIPVSHHVLVFGIMPLLWKKAATATYDLKPQHLRDYSQNNRKNIIKKTLYKNT